MCSFLASVRLAIEEECSFTAAAPASLEGFPLRMSGIDNSYKIDGDVLLVIHASIPPGVHRPTRTVGRLHSNFGGRSNEGGSHGSTVRFGNTTASSWNDSGRRTQNSDPGRVLINTLYVSSI